MLDAPEDAGKYYQETMAKAPAVVPEFYSALTGQDTRKIRALLSDDFTYSSPMGDIASPDGFAGMVSGFGGWVEPSLLVVDGAYVVHAFTFHMTSPASADIQSCDIFEITDGLIQSIKVFNNPADFPPMG